jgi:probable F420-dependent oxidoreductase
LTPRRARRYLPGVLDYGTGLPAVQQIPSRAHAWEREVGGPQIVEAARVAEGAGFAYVSCSDHVFVPASRAVAMGPTWYDAGSTLAFVAGATSRIRLLSHVLVLPYRHPLVVAKQYGTLDHLSGGRVILGVGSGHMKPEFAVLGADYERRGRVSDEYIQAINAAWADEVARFEGETVAFRDVMVSPRPARRPPIWVGGNSRAAVRRAARYGDGWVPWELTPADFASAAAFARRIRAEAARAGEMTLVAPLAVPDTASRDELARGVEEWRTAGATALHVGIGAASFPQFLERLEWFGDQVMKRLS